MGEPQAFSHTTPLVDRFTMFEDSGYLTNTPESTDSVRSLSRFSLTDDKRLLQRQDAAFVADDSGMLYTPKPVGYKPVRCVSFNCNKPFPISTEEYQAIDTLSDPVLNWVGRSDKHFLESEMYVDEVQEMHSDPEDYTQETEVYMPDPLDASLYESLNHEETHSADKYPEVSKQTCMEINDDLAQLAHHPNSENEDWDQLDHYDDRLAKKANRKSVSFETPYGQQLLLQKLEHLKTAPNEPARTKFNNSWREQLRRNGHGYALDFSGKNTVDFLSCLGIHSSHQSVISRILGHLSPGDLESCARVSRAWRDLCSQDRNSAARLGRHRRQLVALKENAAKRSFSGHAHNLGPLAAIGNLCNARSSPPVSPTKSPTKTRHQECAELERAGAVVVLCPRCRGPARVDRPSLEAECFKTACAYLFCTTCRLQSHRPKPCLYATGRKTSKRGAIGSKESRRNLRRLLKR